MRAERAGPCSGEGRGFVLPRRIVDGRISFRPHRAVDKTSLQGLKRRPGPGGPRRKGALLMESGPHWSLETACPFAPASSRQPLVDFSTREPVDPGPRVLGGPQGPALSRRLHQTRPTDDSPERGRGVAAPANIGREPGTGTRFRLRRDAVRREENAPP